MSEKPILFNTEMVRAILEGRKTVTRRILKLPSYIEQSENNPDLYTLYAEGDAYPNQYMENIIGYIRPPYKVGDVLYVRETWNGMRTGNVQVGYQTTYWYKADDNTENPDNKWRPSIHMPKEAARIFLKVTDVRVERLQDITIEDVLKEGCGDIDPNDYASDEWYAHMGLDDNYERAAFAGLWSSTIKEKDLNMYGWEANPYVWVIEFEVIK